LENWQDVHSIPGSLFASTSNVTFFSEICSFFFFLSSEFHFRRGTFDTFVESQQELFFGCVTLVVLALLLRCSNCRLHQVDFLTIPFPLTKGFRQFFTGYMRTGRRTLDITTNLSVISCCWASLTGVCCLFCYLLFFFLLGASLNSSR
jgi:hypothetical protein